MAQHRRPIIRYYRTRKDVKKVSWAVILVTERTFQADPSDAYKFSRLRKKVTKALVHCVKALVKDIQL